MIATILYAIGLVLAVEGLVLALAPSRIEEALAMLLRLPVETRRLIGLCSVAVATFLIWVAQSLLS